MSILSDLEAALWAALASGQTKGKVWDDLGSLLTDDTIAALVAVAGAAERESDCPLCGAETHTAGRRAVPEPHMPDCPLAPLVKEADDE